MTLINPEHAAMPVKDALECFLRLRQLACHLDLHGGEYGDALPHHVGCDFDFGPAAKVGPSFGGGMKGTGGVQDYLIRGAAQDLTRPPHAGIDAEQALFRREC